MDIQKKGEAILNAIRQTDVGSNVIIHNANMSIWCVLKVIAKEHDEDDNEYTIIYPKKG